MSNAVIYAINSTAGTAVASGGAIPFTSVIRRFGCALKLVNNAVVLKDRGYYYVNADVSLVATAADEVTVSLYQDGTAVPGASGTFSVPVIGDYVTIPVSAVVRNCGCGDSVLTVVVSGQGVTLSTATISVVKA